MAYFEPELAYFEPELAYFEPYFACLESFWSPRVLCLYPYFLIELVIGVVVVSFHDIFFSFRCPEFRDLA